MQISRNVLAGFCAVRTKGNQRKRKKGKEVRELAAGGKEEQEFAAAVCVGKEVLCNVHQAGGGGSVGAVRTSGGGVGFPTHVRAGRALLADGGDAVAIAQAERPAGAADLARAGGASKHGAAQRVGLRARARSGAAHAGGEGSDRRGDQRVSLQTPGFLPHSAGFWLSPQLTRPCHTAQALCRERH